LVFPPLQVPKAYTALSSGPLFHCITEQQLLSVILPAYASGDFEGLRMQRLVRRGLRSNQEVFCESGG
jgi:hypothetical protein